MNYWVLFLTFIGVNLDFFFMLIFLLKKYQLIKVAIGYLLGVLILLTASYTVGQVLSSFLPEWILGTLGILPIFIALHDNDDEKKSIKQESQMISVMATYLSVCAGCNLSIFLPVLAGETFTNFLLTLIFIGSLTIVIVLLIKSVANIPTISKTMERHGERLMKICYILVGCYVFWDSGLIRHILQLFDIIIRIVLLSKWR